MGSNPTFSASPLSPPFPLSNSSAPEISAADFALASLAASRRRLTDRPPRTTLPARDKRDHDDLDPAPTGYGGVRHVARHPARVDFLVAEQPAKYALPESRRRRPARMRHRVAARVWTSHDNSRLITEGWARRWRERAREWPSLAAPSPRAR